MKNTMTTLFGVLVLTAAVATASAQSDGSGRLAGTWDVVVTPRVCLTNDPITMFRAAYIFEPGGNFSGVSSGTGSGGRGREQQGVWKHVEGDHYRFRIKTYLFDAAGVATSYQIVTHNGELSDGVLKWSSKGISETFSLDGTQINAGCSTIEASRVVLDQ